MSKSKSARKTVTMLVTVSGPSWLTASQIRNEVRWSIKEGAGYLSHGPDFQELKISLKKIGPAK